MSRPDPIRGSLVAASLAVVMVVIAACGGGASAAPSGPGASPGTSATASASPAAEPSVAASAGASAGASAAASAGAGGGGEACDLLSVEEVAGAMGTEISAAESLPGEPSYCSYRDGSGGLLVATSYTKEAMDAVFEAFAGEAGAVEIDGIGDRAVWSPSTESVYVRKGAAMFGITAGQGSAGPEQRMADGTELAAIAAPRM